MTETLEEAEQRFRERYLTGGQRALIQVEMEVLGSDYQANGYTTVAQADELARVLELGAGDRLLDVGPASIWPGGTDARWSAPIRWTRGWPLPAHERSATASQIATERSWRGAIDFPSEAATSTLCSTPMWSVDCAPSSPC